MIIYYIAIISFILVYWFQYPLIKSDIVPDDNIPLYKKLFNTYKLPVIIVCKILLLYNIFSDMNKCKSNDLDLDLDLFSE